MDSVTNAYKDIILRTKHATSMMWPVQSTILLAGVSNVSIPIIWWMTNAFTRHLASMKIVKYTEIPTVANANLDFIYPNTNASK